jgi:hypothetical protein
VNSRAHLIRRLAGDFVQRMRIALSNADDAAPLVDQLNHDFAEGIAGDVCATLGVDYQAPEPRPEPRDGSRTAKARANSPWQRNKGLRIGKRPELDKV